MNLKKTKAYANEAASCFVYGFKLGLAVGVALIPLTVAAAIIDKANK